MRILFIGDIFGSAGRRVVVDHVADIVKQQRIDLTIANCENAAAGFGITPRLVEELLGTGIHVLTSHDVNDVADGRTARSIGWLNSCHCGTIDDWLHELPRLCRDHGGPDDPPICLHSQERGTVSASIVALPERLDHARWLHAQGPPCTSPLVDCSHLFRKLFAFEGSVLDVRQPAGRP